MLCNWRCHYRVTFQNTDFITNTLFSASNSSITALITALAPSVLKFSNKESPTSKSIFKFSTILSFLTLEKIFKLSKNLNSFLND